MIINTNVSSLVTRNYLRQNNDDLQATMEKLSSGMRINKASDDAAGLAIATRMSTQISGMNVATRNAEDGISLIQTAESALGSISDILQRMRELAVQADNGTYSADDKKSLKAEMDELVKEIEHIADTTKFNGISLLDGSSTSVTLHISDLATDTITVGLTNAQTASLGETSLKLSALDITSGTSTLNGTAGAGGATLTAANGAQDAILAIDAALNSISSDRAEFGAMQNRLGFTVDNLAVANQNTTAAKSRIEDADMAAETSEMSRAKIINQSAIAMLTQANQTPQSILSLLQG